MHYNVFMSKTITIRLDDKLAHKLEHVAEHTSRTKSDVIRDCLRRQLSVEILKLIRRDLVPLAEKQGIYTDEDVFEILKRDPATGVIAGLEADPQRSNPPRGPKSSSPEAAPEK
jgi:Arc/MetJ-type ribon-helix-helix transcriptional regulator